MTQLQRFLVLVLAVIGFLATGGYSIKCYQCNTDPKGEDNCGAYESFDKNKHVPIECNSEESKMPGTFCIKLTMQGPRGFIWDGRWRQVVRRCGSIANTGVTGVCNWGVNENGDYWQECSCSEDGCNPAARTTATVAGLGLVALALLLS